MDFTIDILRTIAWPLAVIVITAIVAFYAERAIALYLNTRHVS